MHFGWQEAAGERICTLQGEILRSFVDPPGHHFWKKCDVFWTSFFVIIFGTIFHRFWMEFGIDFGSILEHFVEEADFVKMILPSRRELRSGRSGRYKSVSFSMIFVVCFLKAVRGPIFDDFWLHFGMDFGTDFEILGKIFASKFCM